MSKWFRRASAIDITSGVTANDEASRIVEIASTTWIRIALTRSRRVNVQMHLNLKMYRAIPIYGWSCGFCFSRSKLCPRLRMLITLSRS